MATGGATWATAGILEASNTMAFSATTEVGSVRPYNHAWWVFTAPITGELVLDTFSSTGGDPDVMDTLIYIYDQASQPDIEDEIDFNDDHVDSPGGGYLSKLATSIVEGTTYHILVGTYDSDGNTVTSYVLNASLQTLAVTEIAVPLTASDYFFRDTGTIDGTLGPRIITNHFGANGFIGIPGGGDVESFITQIEDNSEWGASVGTDDDSGYSHVDNVGFNADVIAAYGGSSDWALYTLGTISGPIDDIPVEAEDLYYRVAYRVRTSTGSGTVDITLYWGTFLDSDSRNYTGGLGTSFVRDETYWSSVPDTLIDNLALGKVEANLFGAVSGEFAETFDVAYLAFELQYTIRTSVDMPEAPSPTPSGAGVGEPRRHFARGR